MAFGYDGSVRIKADLNHQNFDRGLSSMKNQVDSFGATLKKLAGTVAMAFGTAALVRFGKESLMLASDIEEVQNVVDVTFGRGAKQIEEFAKSAAEAYGLSELAAKQYTGTLGAMLKSSGLAVGAAQDMSVALTGLAGDIASFYNLNTDEAFQKIRSGISGEIEPLRQLGINLSVANLEAYALTQGITKSYNAMSQAEQVLLRYNYLMSVTTDAQGDFSRTSGSLANQLRILSLNFDQLKIAVGNALMPIAQAVLPGINAIIAGLTKLATVFSKVTALLFGKSTTVKASSGVESSAIGAADATDKLAESTAGVGEASKKAAKDMKGAQAGFDELNILAGKAADSMGATAGGMGDLGGAGNIEIPEFEAETGNFDEFENEFQTLGEIFVDTLDKMLAAMPSFRDALLNFADNFNEFNQKLYDAFTFPGVKERVEELGRELAESFNDLVNAIDWELWGRTLGAGLNLGLQFLTEFLYTFDWINLGNKLAEFINGLVYEVDWYDFGRLLWAKFKLALETFAGFIIGLDMPALAQAASDIIMGFFNSMQETIANIDWAEIGRQIAEFLNGIDWLGIITSIANAIGEMIPAALELIGGFIQNADTGTLIAAALFLGSKLLPLLLGKVIAPIAKQIGSDLIKQISTAITSGGIGDLVSSIGTAISGIAKAFAGISTVIGGVVLAATSFFDMWNEGFSWAKEAVMLLGIALTAVGAVILGAPAFVAGVIAAVVAGIATAVILIKEHWEEIKNFFISMWEGIKEVAGSIAGWFDEHVIQPVAKFFSDLWENVKQLASDAWNGIVSVWEAVSGWFEENIIKPVKKFFEDLWSGVQTGASNLWNKIVEVWNSAASWFEEHVTKPIGEAFQAVGDFVKGVFNGIIGFVEGLINKAISGINWLIDQLNKISFDVPDWVPAIGGKTFGFNVSHVSEVKLPRLANGAVIPPNQQFAAILGDQRSGVNIEAPLATIEQALQNVMNRNGGMGGITDVNITFNGSLSELARILQPEITVETRRIGTRLVEVGT